MKTQLNKQPSFTGISKDKCEIALICQNIRSLHNVGSIFRTADVYKVKKIYLCGYTGAPPRPEISKVALGAERYIAWERRAQTWKAVEELRKQGWQIIALEKTRSSLPITEFKPKYPIVLILGNEVKGITREILKRSDKIVHLPMYGKKESLNVSVAAGAALAYLRYT